MAPNPRVSKAFQAMRELGIPDEKTKTVLKKLLKVYDKNWELIEQENYRALADAIFDSDESEVSEQMKKLEDAEYKIEQAERMKAVEEETQIQEEPEKPLKRLRLRQQDGQASPSCINPNASGHLLKRPKLEVNELPESQPELQSPAENTVTRPDLRTNPRSVSPLKQSSNYGKQADLPILLVKPKDEPLTDEPLRVEDPLALIMPDLGSDYGGEPPVNIDAIPHNDSLKTVNDFEKETENGFEETVNDFEKETENGFEETVNDFEKETENGFEETVNDFEKETENAFEEDNHFIPDDVIDIAKGQENVVISLVNEVNSECPLSFQYIPRNAVFQNAYVNYSLASITNENCCSTCFGNCLTSSTSCPCALQTGGEFAYTNEGTIKEDLVDDCINTICDPQKYHLSYCKECPLEKPKNEGVLGSCKGHLERSFIKECWLKCGCNKKCGNRVVQCGIRYKLQVFMTPDGKGWGLRALEDLPKGAFVCEFVGEVLTCKELYDRVSRSYRKNEYTYPVFLDAEWGEESELKEDEALCLDATNYGNMARFINHRCFDANLLEIPVEVENPDRHYYHLAFFTSRKVKALEELTRDYGIDFDDNDDLVKAFECECGSKFCRDIKGLSGSKKRKCAQS